MAKQVQSGIPSKGNSPMWEATQHRDWRASLAKMYSYFVVWGKWLAVEAWAVTLVTTSQTWRALRYAYSFGRCCILRGAFRRARLALGEAIYRKEEGDEALRRGIRQLDQQIEQALAAKRSAKSCLARREHLLENMAETSLATPSGRVSGKEYDRATALRDKWKLANESAQSQRANLLPHGVRQRLQVVIGFGLLLLIGVSILPVRPSAGDSGKMAAGGQTKLRNIENDSANHEGRAPTPTVEATLRHLQAKLNDSVPSTRASAAKALGNLGAGASSAIPSLCSLLKDEDHVVRRVAAEALGKIGPEARGAVGALNEAIKDKEMWFREEAVTALGRIGADAAPAIPALIDVYVEACHSHQKLSDAAVITLGRIGQPAVEPLVERLRRSTPDNDASICAVRALGELGADAIDAVPAILDRVRKQPLEDRYNSDLERYRHHAKAALAKICRSRPSTLVTAAKDADARIRACATESLGEIGGPSHIAAQPIVTALEDQDYRVRLRAIRSLASARIDARTAVPALINLLREERRSQEARERKGGGYDPERGPLDPNEIPREAITVLGSYGADAAPAVTALIEELRRGCTNEAGDALGKIGKAAVPKLVKTLGDRDPRGFPFESPVNLPSRIAHTRLGAARSLGLIGPDAQDAVVPLLGLLDETDDGIERNRDLIFRAIESIGKAPRETLAVLVRLLKSPESRKRALAIALLSSVGEEEAFVAISEALCDADREIRAMAVGRLSGSGEVTKFASIIPKLAEALTAKDPEVRLFAARALGDIGMPAAVALQALEAIADDSDVRIRECVKTAIGKIKGRPPER